MRILIVLGRRDEPTDAVVDYSAHLSEHLQKRGHQVTMVSLEWTRKGWIASLDHLNSGIQAGDFDWVVIQHTPHMWCRRGWFPGVLLPILAGRALRQRLTLLIHDPVCTPGLGTINRWRAFLQVVTLRTASRLVHRRIVTIPPSRIPWIRDRRGPFHFIPIGPNILPQLGIKDRRSPQTPFTLAIFGSSGREEELSTISHVARRLAGELNQTRIVLIGRGSREAFAELDGSFGSGIEMSATGVIASEDVSQVLFNAHAFLFIRGGVSTRRGTVITAMAHGLPIVGYAGAETSAPLLDAGIQFAPYGDREALIPALLRIAHDAEWALELGHRNRSCFETYFSWPRVVEQFDLALS